MKLRAGAALSAALVLIGCAVAIMPFNPAFPAAQLDSSWMYAVNAAVGQGLVFGRDLVFTFGPYASLYTLSYLPATDGLAMAAGLVLAAATAAGLLVISADRGRWCAVLLATLLNLLWLRDPLFFLTPLVFLAVVARAVRGRDRPAAGHRLAGAGLVVALALLPLIKGTFAAGSAVALGLGAALLLVRGRWRLAVAGGVLFAGAMSAFWLAAHQPLVALPGFFAAQSQIVGGYTEAMALPGPLWEVGLFAAAAGLVLALNLPAAARAGLPGVAVLGGAAVLLLLAFKAGFVRQDEHVAIAAGSLGLVAGALAVANPGALPALGLVAGLAGWAVLDHAAERIGPRQALLRIEDAYRHAGRGLLDRVQGGAALQQGLADALAGIRAAQPLPPLAGPTDIYSTGQSILLAHGIPWAPRPVLQSYSAYSPALAQADARHLVGGSAPQNVLLGLQAIDDRLPALEDGPSWLPLLGGYEPAAMAGETAVFRRRPGPAPTVLGPQSPAARHALGEVVALPARDDTPLWAQIDVQPTLFGRALSAVFRPPPLRMLVHRADGRVNAFRYVSGMGQAGFVIAPLIADARQLLTLQLPGEHVFDDYRVAAFSIEGDARFWQAAYTLTLAPLHLPPRPSVRSLLFKAPQPASPADAGTAAKCWLDQANGQVVDHTKLLTLDGLVRLTGWGYDEAGEPVEPDALAVSLRRADGTAVLAPATFQSRPDVGAFFHQPQLVHIGFQALMDVHDLAGRYDLALELTTGGRHARCSFGMQADIVPEP